MKSSRDKEYVESPSDIGFIRQADDSATEIGFEVLNKVGAVGLASNNLIPAAAPINSCRPMHYLFHASERFAASDKVLYFRK
jgi:hypothetical protein